MCGKEHQDWAVNSVAEVKQVVTKPPDERDKEVQESTSMLSFFCRRPRISQAWMLVLTDVLIGSPRVTGVCVSLLQDPIEL